MPEQLEEQAAHSITPAESRTLTDSLAEPFPPDPHAPRSRPQPSSDPAPPRRPGRTVLILAIGVMLGLLGAVFFSLVLGYLFHRNTQLDTSSPAIVEQIRKLSRLETVDYSIDKSSRDRRASPCSPTSSLVTGSCSSPTAKSSPA